MADSSIAITGGNVDTRTASNGDHRQCIVVADSATDNITLVNAENELFVRAGQRPSDLGVTVTSASLGAIATLTIPAVAGKFAYLTYLEITLINGAARTGADTQVLVTTTNLPGSPVWTFGSAGAIGTTEFRPIAFQSPIKSSTVNTATTIVGPATTSVRWRINARYYNSL